MKRGTERQRGGEWFELINCFILLRNAPPRYAYILPRNFCSIHIMSCFSFEVKAEKRRESRRFSNVRVMKMNYWAASLYLLAAAPINLSFLWCPRISAFFSMSFVAWWRIDDSHVRLSVCYGALLKGIPERILSKSFTSITSNVHKLGPAHLCHSCSGHITNVRDCIYQWIWVKALYYSAQPPVCVKDYRLFINRIMNKARWIPKKMTVACSLFHHIFKINHHSQKKMSFPCGII